VREKEFVLVRTGDGVCSSDVIGCNESFTDVVRYVYRVPRQHKGWQSVCYAGQRYQLHGGIRNPQFISLNNPIRK